MANYYASARTNYFRVKDLNVFTKELENLYLEIVEGEEGRIALLVQGDGCLPSYDPETEKEIDLPELVSKHLQDEEVAIFMEVGAEKLRYLVGYAEAINNKGERAQVVLNDIYELAAELGSNVTHAEY